MTKSNHKSSSERDEIVSHSLVDVYIGVFQLFWEPVYCFNAWKNMKEAGFQLRTPQFLRGFIPLQVSSTTSTRSGFVEHGNAGSALHRSGDR